jgi:peptidoglycan hydrolase-like protein with peptidoglycan-binding domain
VLGGSRADGIYGLASGDMCVALQREKGLTPEGVVGPRTWQMTWTAIVTDEGQ